MPQGRFLSVVSSWVVALALSACSTDPRPECPLKPAFQLSLSASEGPLPPDTVLRVKYGGGLEEYRLNDLVHTQEVVFCQHRLDGGLPAEAGVPVDELYCEMWTQGAATVTVEATGYPDLEQKIEAQAKDRCILTVDVSLRLDLGDGGVLP